VLPVVDTGRKGNGYNKYRGSYKGEYSALTQLLGKRLRLRSMLCDYA